ncbi:MAG: COR domain-containing protein [Bacteroidota bacterium]
MLPILTAIQQILQLENPFHLAKTRPHDPLGGLIAYSAQGPKYLLDAEGQLIGLNLANTGLTDTQWQAIRELEGLEVSKLKALNLSDNGLKEFRLEGMSNLERLNIEDNPLVFPDESVISQGRGAVLRFLRQIEIQGSEDIYEVKMLILGEGSTGKTTFWHKLQDIHHLVPLPKEQQPSTTGIEIKEGWTFQHVDQADASFLVNLWDFGGQELQHMTHQFFLTKRSFYVILSDGRRGAGNFSYWLNIIKLLGCDLGDEAKPMPVMVILNKRDDVKNPNLPYDPADVKKKFPELAITDEKIDFAEDYPEKGLALERTIQKLLCREMPHLPLPFPKRWNEVRTELYARRKKENYLTWTDYQIICEAVGISDKQEMKDLSRTLHQLGLILHYQEDNKLKNLMVLQPQWALNGIYEILKHDEVGENQGRFTEDLLTNVWDEEGFSYSEQNFLRELMAKDNFDVCFRARENGSELYIAPQLLPEHRPEFVWKLDQERLQYTYQYPFMPKGLIGRLIVQLHAHIQTQKGKKVVWKRGMLLKQEVTLSLTGTAAEALVTEEKDEKNGGDIIRILVKGATSEGRKYVLHTIRKGLESIHRRSFPSLTFQELIPCCCQSCKQADQPSTFERAQLEHFIQNGTHEVQCMSSGEMQRIQDLFEGIEGEGRRKTIPIGPKTLIQDGRVLDALKQLLVLVEKGASENPNKDREIRLLMSQWMDCENKINLGLIMYGSDEEQTIKNRIRNTALDICHQLENSPRP